MRVLVTGSEGYIGKAVCSMLHQFGYEVFGYDRALGDDDFTLRHTGRAVGDIGDIGSYVSSIKPDAVIHLAAMAEVGGSEGKEAEYRRVNVEGTRALLASMEEADCRRLLFASSSSVYGDGWSIDEQTRPSPLSVYGQTKLDAEQLTTEFPTIATVCMRFFNVIGAAFGHGDDHGTSVLPKVFDYVMDRPDESFPVDGMNLRTPDGTPVRDYVYLGDICRAILMLLSRWVTGPVNLGSETAISVLEMICLAGEITGKRLKIHDAGKRPNDVVYQVAYCGHAMDLIRWKAECDIRRAMSSQWLWQRRKVCA